MPVFRRRTRLDVSEEAAFSWHERPGAFQRLLPPWSRVEAIEAPRGVADGTRAVMRISQPPLRWTWVAQHYGYERNRKFCDEQLEGPFKRWRHAHKFTPESDGASVLEDEIDYTLPLGLLGQVFGGPMVARELERTFRFRHRRTRDDLNRHASFSEGDTMRVAVTGASGLVGTELCAFLRSGGHEVIEVVRRKAEKGQAQWDPAAGTIDAQALEGLDAVVHLAGENIASGRWNEDRKRRILESRTQGTRLLCETLAGLRDKPTVLVSSSAVGFYGNRGDEVLDEDSEHGAGFLAEVCRAWESATEAASAAGIRTVTLRTGVVLSARGGALSRMLTPFKLGGGGVVGSGNQYMSWIALDDLVGAIYFALRTTALKGAVNGVSPNPATNRVFTKTLGRVLRRPTVFPLPATVVRLVFGEMGEELLLAGARIHPTRLLKAGFTFLHPELEAALAVELGRA